MKNPKRAQEEQILAVPTLVRILALLDGRMSSRKVRSASPMAGRLNPHP
jgi:hypothetical protein